MTRATPSARADAFTPFGRLVVRFRWTIVAAWAVIVVLAVISGRDVRDHLVSGGISVPGSESQRGAALLERHFDVRPTRSLLVVFRSRTLFVADDAFRAAVTGSLQAANEVDGVVRVVSHYSTGSPRLVSADGHVTFAVINLDGDDESAQALVPAVREAVHAHAGALDDALVLGYPAFGHDLTRTSDADLRRAEMSSLPLTLLLLLVVFGGLVAAALPVSLGMVAVVTALAILGLVARHVETSIFAMNTASMIGLGLGIDFSLLMVSRFREERARGLDVDAACVRSVATAGHSIVVSGLTVMLGLSVMLVYDLTLVRSIALGMLLVAGVAVLAAVTLLPSLLSLLGTKVDALRLPFLRSKAGAAGGAPSRWAAWSRAVMRRPWSFLFVTLAVLVALGLPVREMDAIGVGDSHGIGPGAESRQGIELMAEAFAAGEIAPIVVVIRTREPEGALARPVRDALWKLTRQLEADPRVVRVDSLVNVLPDATHEQFLAFPPSLLRISPRLTGEAMQVLNLGQERDVTLVSVVGRHGETHPDSTSLVEDIRRILVPAQPGLADADVLVTGQTALNLDYRDAIHRQLPLAVGLALLATFVVLVLFFRSIVLPLKAIALNLAGILASYGVLVMVFQWGVLDRLTGFESPGRLSVFPPVILFSILFGLSTDYEVFLLSRVKELYGESGDNVRSVSEGLERTAGIITAAAVIMVVIFGSFALGDVLVLKELGVGLAVAVLLDATIIRIVLVPASMALMGHLNWWLPRWLRRLLG